MIEKNRFNNLMKGLKEAYPNFNMISSKEGLEMWYRMLSDIPYEQLSIAVQKHIATNKYPPSIAEIREHATSPENIIDWSEGWGYVLKALAYYGSYRVGEAMEYLKHKDILTFRVIRRLNFLELCKSEDLNIDRANFRMAYENERKYDRERKAIPQHINDAIEKLAESKRMLETTKQIGEPK